MLCFPPQAWAQTMRTTINLDDELLAKARARTEPMSHAKLMEMAFWALIRRERGRRSFRLKWNQRARIPLEEQRDLDPEVLRAMQAGGRE